MLTLDILAELFSRYQDAYASPVKEFDLAGRRLAFNSQPALMGVINLSADSWYRESVCLTADQAIRRGQVLAAQGAAIVDVGAESTLPQAARVDSAQQNTLLLPVVQGLRAARVLVSVETYELAVARACLEAGANMLNLSGLAQNKALFQLAAAYDAAVILCYVQGDHVRAVNEYQFTADPVAVMYEYFACQTDLASQLGVQKILLDPGLGFYYRNLHDSAARVRFQMQIFLTGFRLRSLGFPICQALPHAFEYFGEEVRCAEPFFAVLAALGKTDLFRTHEVPRTKAVLDTLRSY